MLNTEFIIYGAIFIGVLVLVEGVYLVAFGKSISLNSRVNRRLQMLDKGARRDEVLAKLRKEMDQHMESRGIPLYSMLADRAQKAAIAFTPNQLIMLMGAVSVAAFLGLSIGTEAGLAIRLAMGIGFGVGGVFFWVNSKAKKRLAMIEEQLPDAVELMVRSLRVGHPFSSAISIRWPPRCPCESGPIRWRPSSASSPTNRLMAAISARRSSTWPNGSICRICASSRSR